MNLADPELELIDPTPNVHTLFIHFDKLFFWTKLASRAVVRWSKRMYSCAGVCSYDCGGLCDIALSEPLLKLRPRKDLVETLLHEMIHAYLFITNRDRDRDGHGPNFKAHMHRINNAAGLNISIYHDFHEEVELYQNHWWRCNGPCQFKKPHFGIVRRFVNRAPGPSDYWWNSHIRHCGGTFIKIKEPEKPEKPEKPAKKKVSPKPIADITKYITKNNNNKESGKIPKSILKDSNKIPNKSNLATKNNSSSTIVITKKNNVVFNPKVIKPPDVFSGKGQAINGRSRTSSDGVLETVRNVWANKQLPIKHPDINNPNKTSIGQIKTINSTNSKKHKAEEINISSPPTKMKKIDDYFKTSATSVLKDLYGKDYVIKEVNNNNKRLSVVPVDLDLVNCPVCNTKIRNTEINKHLDECLNKDVVKNISKDPMKPVTSVKPERINHVYDKTKDKYNTNIKKESILSHNIKTEPIINYSANTATETYVTKINNIHTNNSGKSYHISNGKSDTFPFPKEEKLENDDQSYCVPQIKIEPSTSKDSHPNGFKCPCCDKEVHNTSVDEHFDECLAFLDSSTIEGSSTSFNGETIVINDDDDISDESLTFNASGTKSPCPCCLKMIEIADMNDHLDKCLS